MLSLRFAFAFVLLFASGCLDFPENGLYACDRGAGTHCEDVEDPNSVSGRRRRFCVMQNGTSVVPFGATNTTVELRSLTDGKIYPGSADGDAGTFLVPNVPQKLRFELRAHGYFVQTESRVVDLDETELGRPGRGFATAPGTQLVLGNVTGLNPYNAADSIQLSSFGGGLNYFGAEPAVGSPALINYSVDFSAEGLALIDGSKGDDFRVDQLIGNAADGGYSYSSLRKTFSPAPFTMTDGQATTLNGAFVDAAPLQSFTRVWQRSQFDLYKALLAPAPTVDEMGVWVQALPQASVYGAYERFDAPRLASTFSTAVTDLQITLDFANPYTGAEIFVDTVLYCTHTYAVPGAAAYTRFSEISRQDLLSDLPATPLAPRVTPVRNAKLAGTSIFVQQTNVGLTPTVTWDAPTLGTPTMYKVNIYELSNSNGQTVSDYNWDIGTTARTITIPANTLIAGRYYYLLIMALVDGSKSPEHPYRHSFPSGHADAYSAMFSP